jgi:hypothetical protein
MRDTRNRLNNNHYNWIKERIEIWNDNLKIQERYSLVDFICEGKICSNCDGNSDDYYGEGYPCDQCDNGISVNSDMDCDD